MFVEMAVLVVLPPKTATLQDGSGTTSGAARGVESDGKFDHAPVVGSSNSHVALGSGANRSPSAPLNETTAPSASVTICGTASGVERGGEVAHEFVVGL